MKDYGSALGALPEKGNKKPGPYRTQKSPGGKTMKKVELCTLEEKWGAPFVARREVYRFSGGIVTPRHLANEDSRGTGPAGKITVNGRVAYPTASLVAWLEGRLKISGRSNG